MRIGIAKRNTLPNRPSILRGYAYRCNYSKDVESPLEVGVIALESENSGITLVISADMIGIPVDESENITGIITGKFGIPAERIWITSTHTHFAPGFEGCFVMGKGGEIPFGDNPEDAVYRELWINQALDAINEAISNMTECVLEHLEVPVPGIMFNRRTVKKASGKVEMSWIYPENADDFIFSPCEDTVYAWRFVTPDGNSKALLLSAACHPVTGGNDTHNISWDYPGYFRAKAEELFGCPAFFLLGAAGDSVPRLRGSVEQKFQKKIDSRKNIGDILALTIQHNVLLFKQDKNQTVDTKMVSLSVDLPDFVDVENAEKNYQNFDEKAGDDWNMLFIARQLANQYKASKINLPLRVLRLGDKVLAGMPFEVLSEISTRLKAANPNAVLISITGGFNGYLPLEHEFDKGGYEPSPGGTHFAKGTAEKFLYAAIKNTLDI